MAADDDNGDGTGLFDIFSASPLKNNDEGSLDIYAGLDSAVSDSTSKSCVPFRSCLDLYEEILTEEGTAKEATYNDLQVEYGKCQLQMQELMKKFKEIQTQNLNLKNENQSLKKNISALIKTARVEINRKDEEINNLHQRLSEFPHFRNNHKITRTLDVVRTKDHRSRSPHLGDCSKTDHRAKSDISKDAYPNTLLPNLEKEGKSYSEGQNPLHLSTRVEKHCTNGVWSHSHYQSGEGNSNEDNKRGKKDVRHSQYNRETERTRRDSNNSFVDGEPKNKDANPRVQGSPEKYGVGEAKAERENPKLKSTDSHYKSERSTSLWEKEMPRERKHTRVDSQNDKNLERQSERLQNMNRKELQLQDKTERKNDPKFKTPVKDQEHWRKSERVLFPHSKNEIKSYNSSKYQEERRGREDYKRDRGISSHGFQDGRSSSFLSGSRNSKYIYSKEVSVSHQWENTSLKAERHRTENERKRERENKEENRHMRKSPIEHLQKASKEAKKPTPDSKRQTEPKSDKDEVSSNELSKETDNKEFLMKGKNGPSEAKSKDLKLSFMEKLNLTLSPAKKQPVCQDKPHQLTDVPKSNGICDSQSPGKTKIMTYVPFDSEHSTEENKSKLLEPQDVLPKTSELSICVPESKSKEENILLVKTVENALPCECDTELSLTIPVEIEQTVSSFPSTEAVNNSDCTRVAASVAMDVLQTHVSQNFDLGLDTKGHAGLSSCIISEGTEMKVILPTKSTETSEDLQPLVEEPGILSKNCFEDSNPKFEPSLVDTPVVENKSHHLEPCSPKETLACSPQQTKLMDYRTEIGETNSMYHDDENSVLSIDLNHLRPIPEVISPLNSPVRPAAKILRMESPSPIPSYNNNHKDVFPSNSTSKNLSDLNKENQKPVLKFDKSSEANSKDELEEGEIRSDSEESSQQKHFEKSTRPRASEVQKTKTNPVDRKNAVHFHKDHRKTAVKVHQNDSKWNKRPNESSRSSKTERKDKTMSISCLEKILPIIPVPSSVWEIMHMLRMIGNHVRKNYMKFKVKFSLIQFHRIIESAILSLTSLIKYLDLSKICTSVSTLQKNLCDTVESNLKQIKKNGIVDRLFEQQQPDMKKKLWKFVDEQLDYLFEKLKKILVKFCDSVKFGNDNNEGKLGKKYKERSQYSNCQKRNMDNSSKEMRKEKLPKSEASVNYKSSLECKKPEGIPQDQNSININTAKHDMKKSFNTCFDNKKNSESEEHPLELNYQSTLKPGKNEGNTVDETQISQHAGLKPERTFEILTEQQASSLTFNLVSDAQMGEIFKSLLQGSDLLDSSVNCTEKAEWELKTPEKQLLESLKCDSIPACTTEELVSEVASPCPKVIGDDNWSLLSSEKGPSLSSGLSLPVHPDVLDENCMFEVSTNIALSKDNIYSSEKSKPCISSILLEDLAVSLTIPSPLKSDGHLSFLKPEVLSSSTPEEVISAHFSEDALLEEEDASEQDIHLALESDNSSSKSSCSSWTSRSVAPGFQYHPNLPMHAVIMEKSNDHFIVKIRRAAPSTSPSLKHSMVVEESLASLSQIGKEAGEAEEKEPILCPSTVVKPMEGLENCEKNIGDSKSTDEGQNSVMQTQVPCIYEFLKDTSCKMGHCDEMTDDCFKLQVWDSKVPENLEELPSVEKVPQSTEDHLPNTYIDLTKDPVTETKNLGELIEVTVLNIDHLEHSGTNLDQNTQILVNSVQPDTIASFIDLTQDVSCESKNKVSGPVLTVEGLDCPVICVDEEKTQNANNPLTCTEDTCIDLTPESPSSCEIKKDALKSELPSHSDSIDLTGTLDNIYGKRKNCSDPNHSQKKQRKETDLTSNEKTKKLGQHSSKNDETHRKKASKKRDPTVSKDLSSLKTSPGIKDSAALNNSPTSLSANNVIKKKGEIIVSWTRNDDREILLECQKRMPSLKTFTYLAVKLNKNPNQVSERFQQLKKLFEKSKCR